ncbi:hypothetical protein ABIB60_002403 [Hymenobacter sp. UYP22]
MKHQKRPLSRLLSFYLLSYPSLLYANHTR